MSQRNEREQTTSWLCFCMLYFTGSQFTFIGWLGGTDIQMIVTVLIEIIVTIILIKLIVIIKL